MTKERPLVSVFTPIYNNAKLVIPAIETLRNQTYPSDRIQHLIVDDGSADDSVKLITEFIKKTGHPCKFIVNPQNMGICKTYNKLLKEHAKGDYFIGLCDDLWDPEKLSCSVETLENQTNEYVAVYSDMHLCDGEGALLPGTFYSEYNLFFQREKISPLQGNIFDHLIKNNFLTAPTILIRISALTKAGGFDENIKFEDYDLYLRLLKENKIVFSEQTQVTYRIHANNFHKTAGSQALDMFNLYCKHQSHPTARKNALKQFAKAYKINPKKAADRILKSPFQNTFLNFLTQRGIPHLFLRGFIKIRYSI